MIKKKVVKKEEPKERVLPKEEIADPPQRVPENRYLAERLKLKLGGKPTKNEKSPG